MTELEWLRACDNDPLGAIDQVFHVGQHARASERKARLFAAACCRRIWNLLPRPNQRIVEAVERFADGLVSWEKVEQAVAAAPRPADEPASWKEDQCTYSPGRPALQAAQKTAWYAAGSTASHAWSVKDRFGLEPNDFETDLLGEIVGNPFRPVSLHPAWRTADVRRLARVIYQERAFERLPILADALEEAGCTSTEVLGHLRGQAEHVLGCWALDAVLGLT
jgi:hypothetical protein